MTPDTAAFLTSPQGRQALAQGERLAGDELARQTALRKQWPAELAAAVVEQIELRQRAAAKFAEACKMLFVREALEQASGQIAAAYRAERFAAFETVLDVCCGIGGDTIELAKRCGRVIAIDRDPVRIALARHNARVCGVGGKVEFLCADAAALESLPCADAAFVDPSRRVGGRRRIRIEDYEPGLDALERVMASVRAGGIKCAPGLDWENAPAGCSVELISVGGECKEAVLWFGELKRDRRMATVLPTRATLEEAPDARAQVSAPLRYVYEPDAAVIRAHLVETLAAKLGLCKLEDRIAYLTGDELVASRFASVFEVLGWTRYNSKRLNALLRELDVGAVTIKRRGFPASEAEVRGKLKLRGERRAVLVLSRAPARGHYAMVCRA